MIQPQQYTQQNEGFSREQIDMLEASLNMSLIKHRKGGGGRQLAYITGKTAMDTANRIFGYGKWGTRVVSRDHKVITDGKKGTMEFYTCDIELDVIGATFPFAGDGVGIVTEPFTVEMHEKAYKDAYTDALKRALRHYGDQFGLVLYDEDSYVQAPDGRRVQVKAVPVKSRNQPAQIIEAGKAPKVIEAPKEPSLSLLIKTAKLRAKGMGLATDAREWAALLKSLKLTEIKSPVDIAVIDGHMTAIERGVVTVGSED